VENEGMNKKSNQMISSSVRALFFVFVLLFALLSPHAAAEIIPTGWYWPTTSIDFCGYFGWLEYNSPSYPWHMAQDMCNPQGSPVYSIGDGEVILTSVDVGGYGPNYTNGGALVARCQAADGTWFTVLLMRAQLNRHVTFHFFYRTLLHAKWLKGLRLKAQGRHP